MKQFTVIHTQEVPFLGVGQYLCVVTDAETAAQAADKCVRAITGHGTIIAVFEGDVQPVLGNQMMNVWVHKEGVMHKMKVAPYLHLYTNPVKQIEDSMRREYLQGKERDGRATALWLLSCVPHMTSLTLSALFGLHRNSIRQQIRTVEYQIAKAINTGNNNHSYPKWLKRLEDAGAIPTQDKGTILEHHNFKFWDDFPTKRELERRLDRQVKKFLSRIRDKKADERRISDRRGYSRPVE
jgi:hypothetical protein